MPLKKAKYALEKGWLKVMEGEQFDHILKTSKTTFSNILTSFQSLQSEVRIIGNYD